MTTATLERVTRHAGALAARLGVSVRLPADTPQRRARSALDQAWAALARADIGVTYHSDHEALTVLEESYLLATEAP